MALIFHFLENPNPTNKITGFNVHCIAGIVKLQAINLLVTILHYMALGP